MSTKPPNLAAVDKLMAATLLTVFAHACAYFTLGKHTPARAEEPAQAAPAPEQPRCTENICFMRGFGR